MQKENWEEIRHNLGDIVVDSEIMFTKKSDKIIEMIKSLLQTQKEEILETIEMLPKFKFDRGYGSEDNCNCEIVEAYIGGDYINFEEIKNKIKEI